MFLGPDRPMKYKDVKFLFISEAYVLVMGVLEMVAMFSSHQLKVIK